VCVCVLTVNNVYLPQYMSYHTYKYEYY